MDCPVAFTDPDRLGGCAGPPLASHRRRAISVGFGRRTPDPRVDSSLGFGWGRMDRLDVASKSDAHMRNMRRSEVLDRRRVHGVRF